MKVVVNKTRNMDERGILSSKGFEQIWRKEGEIIKTGSKAFEQKAGRRV